MTLTRLNIQDWQRRFFAGPKVWGIFVQGEFNGHLYESEEAAQCEVDWYKARGKAATKGFFYIHSLELAKERWQL